MSAFLLTILVINLITLAIIFAGIVLFRAFTRTIENKASDLEAKARSIFYPAKEGELSQAGQIWQQLSATLGQQVAVQIKQTLLGASSGVARAEKAASEAILEDAANQANPLLGMLLSGFPKLKQKVGQNPNIAAAALSMLSNMKAKAPESNNGQGPAASGGFAARAKM